MDREKSFRQIQYAILCLRLRRRIEKIWQLSADVVEGIRQILQKEV